MNVVEGLSKYFGDHPTWQYLFVYGPAMFTVAYPLVVYSVYFYTRESLQKNQSPEIMYYTIFYFVVFFRSQYTNSFISFESIHFKIVYFVIGTNKKA